MTHHEHVVRSGFFLLAFMAAGFLAPGVSIADYVEEPKLIPSMAGESDRVGRSIDISGDGSTLVVGAPAGFIGSEGPGAAYVYQRIEGDWVESAQLLPHDSHSEDMFGHDVAINHDGSVIVVGSWRADVADGGVYVFAASTTGWVEQAELVADDGPQAYFGFAVAIGGDGDVIVAGSPSFVTGGAGRVYVFSAASTGWTQTAELNGMTADTSGFGGAVAVDGAGVTLAVGDGVADVIDVFVEDGSGWGHDGTLTGEALGSSVALSADGNTLIGGANFSWTGSGYAAVYARASSGWLEQALLTPGAPENGDWFASAVDVDGDGDKVVVGANFADAGTETEEGAVYVFTLGDGMWTEQARLIASDASFNDEFGGSVAINDGGSNILVGAHNKESFEPPEYRGAAYSYVMAANVGAIPVGMAAPRARCINLTTGQSVSATVLSGDGFDCVASGLDVRPGELVEVRVRGVAQ